MAEARENEIKLRLNDNEIARLDEIRPRGITRAAFVRSLLRDPQHDSEVASRSEALSILTALARDGKVSAAIALERALREGDSEQEDSELWKVIRG